MGDVSSKSTYLTYRALGTAIAALPEPVASALAAVIGSVMAHRPGLATTMSMRHITRVLASASPNATPDPDLVKRWSRRAFPAYARYWVEGARLPTVSPATVRQRIEVERGWEQLLEGMAAGKGVILALPHIGSWEWGGAFLSLVGLPMTAVAERIEPPELFEWFIRQREEMGLTIVPLDGESGGVMLRTLRDGGLVGLLCDRDLVGTGTEVEYFGERTTLPGGPATLALRTGAMLLPAAVYSGPGDDHTAVIGTPIDPTRQANFRADVQRMTQDIAVQFEQFVRRAPEQWHLFQPNWPSDHEAMA